MPAGSTLTDGDKFELSDGGTRIVFEFSTDASVGLGNVPVRFAATDAPFVIAQKVRDAINNPNVQSRLNIRAATSGGNDTGTAGRDLRLHLFGNASFRTIQATQIGSAIQVQAHQGSSDKNVTRDQGQVIIQNSFIRESRDYGVWSEPARRLADDRDDLTGIESLIMQRIPNLVGQQAVRNLLDPNDSVIGGLVPGVVVQNNVLEEGGLGGVKIQGENPIWMISPSAIPTTDNLSTVNTTNPPAHFGELLRDALNTMTIDVDRTRVNFEFEDVSVAGEGNGYNVNNVPIFFRRDGNLLYQRLDFAPNVALVRQLWKPCMRFAMRFLVASW